MPFALTLVDRRRTGAGTTKPKEQQMAKKQAGENGGKMTVVTGNVAEFRRVAKLKVEDWTRE